MIVQFKLRNVLSFKDEAVLDMTAIPAYKEHSYNLINIGTGEKLLKVAAIYGANASGKTNFYCGMGQFWSIIRNSMNAIDQIEEDVLESSYTPFFFDGSRSPSEFQIIACSNTAEMTYGFEYNDKRIISEWYYRRDFETKRSTTIFERKDETILLGNTIKRECEKYKEQIPHDALALTFFSRLKLDTVVFQELFSQINGMTVVDTDVFENKRFVEKLLPNVIDNNKNELLDFLSAIDVGIADISYETVDKRIEFFSTHRGKNGSDYKINLFSESKGTIKCIMIYILASSIIKRNGVLVVDELNAKLHPLLLKYVIDLFYKEDSKAQLIYTTHDTTLLDKKFFRRDQVWFVDKDECGHSRLTALSDYKVRSDASFEKDYLSGVYGGIPMLREFPLMNEADHGER